jgi:superfamily II DNA/RNA helicase
VRKADPLDNSNIAEAGSEAAIAFRKEHKIEVFDKCSAVLPEPLLSFEACVKDFGEKVVAKLQADFKTPSPIQAQSWPVALSGKDMVAVAKTGSGKTLAFLLPSLCVAVRERQSGSKSAISVVVLAPTRELATQIEEVVVKFAGIVGVPSTCAYGGVPKPPQAKALKSMSHGLVVATPGRLVDHMHDGSVNLKGCKVTVLDEADRMLDMGFQPQLAEIFEALPPAGERQLLLFSATWPKAVKKMAATYLASEGNFHLSIGSSNEKGPTANTSVTQVFFQKNDAEKDDELLRELFKMEDTAKVIVFTNTKRRADNVANKVLWANGYPCCSLHGDKPQIEREKALKQFRSGELSILVATDACARGLDIDNVSHVVNYDMPRDVEGYIHRIGRTGRAGNKGTSITFWNADFDTECAPALAKIAQDAGQLVPPWLEKAATKMGQGKKMWAVAKIAEVKLDA